MASDTAANIETTVKRKLLQSSKFAMGSLVLFACRYKSIAWVIRTEAWDGSRIP